LWESCEKNCLLQSFIGLSSTFTTKAMVVFTAILVVIIKLDFIGSFAAVVFEESDFMVIVGFLAVTVFSYFPF
jgi:hypothetical protein